MSSVANEVRDLASKVEETSVRQAAAYRAGHVEDEEIVQTRHYGALQRRRSLPTSSYGRKARDSSLVAGGVVGGCRGRLVHCNRASVTWRRRAGPSPGRRPLAQDRSPSALGAATHSCGSCRGRTARHGPTDRLRRPGCESRSRKRQYASRHDAIDDAPGDDGAHTDSTLAYDHNGTTSPRAAHGTTDDGTPAGRSARLHLLAAERLSNQPFFGARWHVQGSFRLTPSTGRTRDRFPAEP